MTAAYKTRPGVVTSSGSSSAGMIPILDSNGKLDASVLPSVMQAGSDNALAAGVGGKFTSISVAFPVAFGSVPKVMLTVTSGSSSTSGGVYVRSSATNIDQFGFDAEFSTLTGGTSADATSNSDIIGSVDFDWIAVEL